MVQRLTHLHGTRWLGLWLIVKAGIRKRWFDYDFHHTMYETDSALLPGRVTDLDDENMEIENRQAKLQSIQEVFNNGEEEIECYLEEAVNAVLSKLQTSIIERNIFVRIYAEDDISIYTKPKLLYVILENLIENAVKYSSQGNIQSYIEISIRKENEILELVIEDNGAGIEEKAFKSIFQANQNKLDRLAKRGLGLYIVREALKKVGGTINFSSEKSCFTRIKLQLNTLPTQNNAVLPQKKKISL